MKYPIPEKALAQHIAILGKTGSGKTTAAKAGSELILDAGDRLCVIDPTGAWWGMKSSATGKSAGYPIVIFGGLHADFPLSAGHGEAVAEIVGTSNTPAVIDTSQMRVSERTRFFTDFADAIMRKNRGPLHLVIDESHLFAPQGKVPDPASGAMLSAANNLVSGGRSRGLRIILISQRPAKLHKDSLSQVETMVAMRLIAPQDRRAVEEWIKDNADLAKGREIIESLATLKTGQAWVWAPELGVLERVQFPRIRTFDSSAAPENGDDGKGPVLASIDKVSIESMLKTHAGHVAANDPAELKKRIRELEAQIRKAPENVDVVSVKEKAYAEGLAIGKRETLKHAASVMRTIGEDIAQMFAKALAKQTILEREIGAVAEKPERSGRSPYRPAAGPQGSRNGTEAAATRAPQIDGLTPSGTDNIRKISPPGRKVLAVLSQFEGCTASKLCLLTGYKYSGGFQNALSELRTLGLIVGANTEVMRITAAGMEFGPFPELPTGRALGQYWTQHPSFGKCAREILRVLVEREQAMSAEAICKATGYQYSGGFQNALSELRTAGVLVGKNTEPMRAHEDLF